MHCYFDYAASAPLRPEVKSLIRELLELPLGNPSSLHLPGRRARMLLEEARESCAASLGAEVEEIVFTSGATEANNLALSGITGHVLVSAVEHPSVLQCARGLNVEVIPVDRQGRVDPERVSRMIRPDTALISVMAANNEVGTLQPIAELAALRVPLHVDAVQAHDFRVIPGVDLMSVSGHKLGAPVGTGLLYVRKGLLLNPLLVGGSQEDSRRAGTSNAVGAAALALALRLSRQPSRVAILRERLERMEMPGAVLLGRDAPRAPHISAWLLGIPAETVLVALDLEDIHASSGSACSSHSIEPSTVVQAMGYSREESRQLVRFSLGWGTTEAEVDRLTSTLPGLLCGRVAA